MKPRNVRRKRAQRPEREPLPPLRQRVGAAWARSRARLAPLGRPFRIALQVVAGLLALSAAVGVGKLVQQHMRRAEAFATSRIDVEGLERITREELLDAAGLSLGQNVFEVSPEQAQRRLQAHPWVAEADVSRRLPDQYAIHVRERRAVALLVVETCADELQPVAGADCEDRPASNLYLVSEEGGVFKRLEGDDPVDMPVITGVPRQRFGTDAQFRSEVLLEAVSLLSDYRAAGLWRRMPIAEIHLEPDEGFSLYAGDDLTHVRLGDPPFETKLRRMRKVLDRLDSEQASAAYVYLDNSRRPERVTVRLR